MSRLRLFRISVSVIRTMFPNNAIAIAIFLLVVNAVVQVNEKQLLITNFILNGGLIVNYVFIFIPGFLLIHLINLKIIERYLKPYSYERSKYVRLLLFISGVSSFVYSTAVAVTIYSTIGLSKHARLVELFSRDNLYVLFCWVIIFSWYLFILSLFMTQVAQVTDNQLIAAMITLFIVSLEALSIFMWGKALLLKQLVMSETAVGYIQGNFMHLILLFGGVTALLIVIINETIQNDDWISKSRD